ncbi:methyltransferase [Actinoplanes sp. ATCC 53533]|uniref:SAM-dependent methyltransferase n=1 Tax=Actinoplanes sp. ATCC 53533 TaxID=1288362 RepID=UPI000F77DF9F|nr:SAM-dependent methyltransferase [Actinoplanes sp. ATCC 53533]RSM56826.1 methyltransferase [Actinoplanes sp. ATCC 53533]
MTPVTRSAALDTGVPHPARIYDYWLGGKDNFAPDRAVGEQIIKAVPTVAMMVRANRSWMLRTIRYLVREAGIRQFLDIGTGIPTAPNLHQAAQKIAPACRVLYLDNDPIVLTHARALLPSTPQGHCEYLDADVRDISRVLTSPELAATIDPSKPVGIMCASVLMLLADADDPWGLMARLRDWAPPGSHLAISHPTADPNPDAMAAVVATTAKVGITFVPRTHEQVARMFGDWELIGPGLVPVLAWRPDEPPEDPNAAYYWAGAARKPDEADGGQPSATGVSP